MGELGTLRDQGLRVILVVLQDASLALIELKQRQADCRNSASGSDAPTCRRWRRPSAGQESRSHRWKICAPP